MGTKMILGIGLHDWYIQIPFEQYRFWARRRYFYFLPFIVQNKALTSVSPFDNSTARIIGHTHENVFTDALIEHLERYKDPFLNRKEVASNNGFRDSRLDWVKRGLPSHKQRGRVYVCLQIIKAHLRELSYFLDN